MNDDNFFSIDRLVEFGLGVAVARQMTASMNQAIENTQFPGPRNVPPAAAPKNYHAMLEGRAAGPFTENELSRLITEGKVSKSTYIWRPGMPRWETAENLAEVLRLVALAPPPFNPEGAA
jgi:hypothetical protein